MFKFMDAAVTAFRNGQFLASFNFSEKDVLEYRVAYILVDTNPNLVGTLEKYSHMLSDAQNMGIDDAFADSAHQLSLEIQ